MPHPDYIRIEAQIGKDFVDATIYVDDPAADFHLENIYEYIKELIYSPPLDEEFE